MLEVVGKKMERQRYTEITRGSGGGEKRSLPISLGPSKQAGAAEAECEDREASDTGALVPPCSGSWGKSVTFSEPRAALRTGTREGRSGQGEASLSSCVICEEPLHKAEPRFRGR